jgi:WD40 repeat protein
MGILAMLITSLISADGKALVSSSADKKIKVWDFISGKEIRTILEYSIPINYFAISPDWETIVTGGTNQTLKIWDFTTGKELRTLTGHSSYVNYVTISPDGKN